MDHASTVWVGRFDDGEIVIFDSRRQRRDEPNSVVLWSERDRTYSGYDRQIARSNVRALDDPQLLSTVLSHYSDFVRADTEGRHRGRLHDLNLTYRGVRTSLRRHPRSAHCYDCALELDTNFDMECAACGWILCHCGACGCGYERLRPPGPHK